MGVRSVSRVEGEDVGDSHGVGGSRGSHRDLPHVDSLDFPANQAGIGTKGQRCIFGVAIHGVALDLEVSTDRESQPGVQARTDCFDRIVPSRAAERTLVYTPAVQLYPVRRLIEWPT